jgi:hypothetical protein
MNNFEKPNKTQQNPTKPNKTQQNPTKPNKTQQNQMINIIKRIIFIE